MNNAVRSAARLQTQGKGEASEPQQEVTQLFPKLAAVKASRALFLHASFAFLSARWDELHSAKSQQGSHC